MDGCTQHRIYRNRLTSGDFYFIYLFLAVFVNINCKSSLGWGGSVVLVSDYSRDEKQKHVAVTAGNELIYSFFSFSNLLVLF